MSSRDLTEALEQLTGTSRYGGQTLPDAPARGAKPAQASSAKNLGSASGGGLASPLTETAYSAREWHPARYVTSSDGIFRLQIRAVKKISFTDAGGNSADLIFKDKT